MGCCKYITSFMSTFATRLRELRGTESQASFALAIGVNRVQYAKYESGQNAPSVEILERICRVHACSADWLLGLRESTPNDSQTQNSNSKLPQCSNCPHRKLAEKMRKMLGGG